MDSREAQQKLLTIESQCAGAIEKAHRELSKATDALRSKLQTFNYGLLRPDIMEIERVLREVQPELEKVKSVEKLAAVFKGTVGAGAWPKSPGIGAKTGGLRASLAAILLTVKSVVSNLKAVLEVLNSQPDIEHGLALLERNAIGDYLALSDEILRIVPETERNLARGRD